MSGTAPPTELNSISYQGMPNLGVPMVGHDGVVSLAWYRLFVSLYNVTLAGLPTLPAGVSASNPNSLTLAGVHSDFGTSQAEQDAAFLASQTAQNVSIATLLDDVVILQNEINALTARINTLQGQVTALQGQVDGLTVFTGTTGGATGGGAGAPPANVAAYMQIRLGTTNFRVPLYNP